MFPIYIVVGGGAGMFSVLEWVMKGAVWLRAAAASCASWIQDGAEELCGGKGARYAGGL